MSKKILYIIGNGFDIYHDLKTKYSDFREYTQRYNPNLRYSLDTYFDADLWSDFENNLAQLSIDEICSDNEELLPDEDSDKDGDQYSLPDKMEQTIFALTVELKNTLRDWILGLEFPSKANDLILTLDKNAKFLTFNYSDTLERLYRIKPDQITYLHNKAISERRSFRPDEQDYLRDDSDIIIGHAVGDLKFKKPHINKGGIKTYYACDEAFEASKLYDNFKNTAQVISSNSQFFSSISDIEKIIIIGHSLSDIDMPYFKEIVKKAVNVREWKITYSKKEYLYSIKTQFAKFMNDSKIVEFVDMYDDIKNLC
jgi:hypothetical protein